MGVRLGVRYGSTAGSTVWEYGMGVRYGSTEPNPVADGAAALTEPSSNLGRMWEHGIWRHGLIG